MRIQNAASKTLATTASAPQEKGSQSLSFLSLLSGKVSEAGDTATPLTPVTAHAQKQNGDSRRDGRMTFVNNLLPQKNDTVKAAAIPNVSNEIPPSSVKTNRGTAQHSSSRPATSTAADTVEVPVANVQATQPATPIAMQPGLTINVASGDGSEGVEAAHPANNTGRAMDSGRSAQKTQVEQQGFALLDVDAEGTQVPASQGDAVGTAADNAPQTTATQQASASSTLQAAALTLQDASRTPAAGGINAKPSRPVQKIATGDAAPSKTDREARTSDDTKINDAAANTDKPNHIADTDRQPAQSVPVVSSHASAADGKSPQGSASIQILPQHDAPVAANAVHAGTPTPTTGMDHAHDVDGPANLQASGVNAARVIQSMNQSEMRVGMRSAEFGEVSIRTAISQQQMVTQISVNHAELGRAISAHVPGVQAKLDEIGLRASIEIHQGGNSFAGDRGQSSQQQQRSFTASQPMNHSAMPHEIEASGTMLSTISEEGYRLDIRA